MLVLIVVSLFILMLSIHDYTGYIIYGGETFENMKVVEVNSTVSNVSVFISFGDYRPSRCRAGILVASEGIPVDFVTYNETYESENGTCISATVLFRNIQQVTQVIDANITDNITTNMTSNEWPQL